MEPMIRTLNALADSCWTWLPNAALQAAGVGLAALLFVKLASRLPSPLRHAILLLAVIKFVVPPGLDSPTSLFTHLPIEQLASTDSPESYAAANVSPTAPIIEVAAAEALVDPTVGGRTSSTPADLSVGSPEATAAIATTFAPRMSARAWLLLLWAAGTLLVGAWIARQLVLLRGVVHRSRLASPELRDRFGKICRGLGMNRAPDLLLTDDSVPPSSFGVLRRRVLVPRAVLALTDREIDCVLAHEAAHHRRGDILVNTALWIVQAVWWFHPVLWALARTLRRVREECCDDLLMSRGVVTDEEYCSTLLRTASFSCAASAGALAAGLGRHPLGLRFARIMDGSLRRSAHLGITGFAALATLAATLLPGAASPPIEDARSPNDHVIVLRGRVLDAQGIPVGGAQLLVTGSMNDDFELTSWNEAGSSAPDGTFAVAVDLDKTRMPGNAKPTLCAVARGMGIGWFRPAECVSQDSLVIQMSVESMMSGRVLDLQGNGVAGVTVRPVRIFESTDGDLDSWLRHVEAGDDHPYNHLEHRTTIIPGMGTCEAAVTDSRGDFTLYGLGKDRVILALLEGPTIQTTLSHLVNRDIGSVKARNEFSVKKTYHGSPAELFVAPTRPIVGRVTDAVTGEPVSGITVTPRAGQGAPATFVKGITDLDGRYRLTGLSVGAKGRIHTELDFGRRYLSASTALPDREGVEPLTVDLKLYRGVHVTGSIRELGTGDPVRDATVVYSPASDNPLAIDSSADPSGFKKNERDGSFELLALPGQGVIAVFADEGFLTVSQRDSGDELKSTPSYAMISLDVTHGFHAVQFSEAVETHDCAIVLHRGAKVAARLVDSDGHGVTGARVYGETTRPTWTDADTAADHIELQGFNPKTPRVVRAVQRELGLVGRLVIENSEDPVIRMAPGGRVIGRILDVDGLPVSGASITLQLRDAGTEDFSSGTPWRIKTDEEGRFSIPCLEPGVEYRVQTHEMPTLGQSASSEMGMMVTFAIPVTLADDLRVEAGETLNLGDLGDASR